jgi:nucleotide-binding universal stress UspA family protein
MRVLLLVDGLHGEELLESLGRLLELGRAELLLVYARGPAPRGALELVMHRAGPHHLRPGRELALDREEVARGERALAEAALAAQPLCASVEAVQVAGEAGRALCELAASRQAAVVALRTAGHLGPVARFVSDHCPCPVLLLR